MSSVLFSDADLTFFILLLVIAAVFIASNGLETTARASTAVFFFTVISIFSVMLATAEHFDILNITLSENAVSPLMQNALLSVSRTTEPITLLFLYPEIKTPKYRDCFTFITLFGVSSAAVLGFIAGVMGEYGDKQMFRLYALTQIAEFGVFERLDALLAGVWVLCSLFRTAYYLYVSTRCVSVNCRQQHSRYPLLLSGGFTFVFYLILSKDTETFSDYLKSGINEILYITAIFVLPVFLMAVKKRLCISSRKDINSQ